MKSVAYSITVFLGALCLTLCVTLIAIAGANERQQIRIQSRQQALNRGMLGPNAQQVSGRVLQDLALAAEHNAEIRKILIQHGYQVQQATPSESPGAAKDVAQKAASP
jgi:hypothetical protein